MEHVLLETESQLPELRPLVTEYVFLLSKVSVRLASFWDGDREASPDVLLQAGATLYNQLLLILSRSAKESGLLTEAAAGQRLIV